MLLRTGPHFVQNAEVLCKVGSGLTQAPAPRASPKKSSSSV